MVESKCVLLTGSTGVIGSALRPQLAHHRVISLTHRRQVGSESVTGDLTQPRFGLQDDVYRALTSTVDTVVHCAAVTDFTTGPEAVNSLNVAGTRRVADFVAEADARLIHVSTAFVARAELTRRSETREAAARPEDYLDSKRAGEAVIRQSGVPAVIVRPSVVIGDSASGAMASFQGVHAILGAVLRNRLPLVPFSPSSRVDVIPQDLVVAALQSLVDSEVRAGEFWLTAGQRALTAGRMVELCLEVADDLGLEVTPPRLVAPDMVDRLIRPVFIDPLPRAARRQFDDLMAMAALFAGADPFATSYGNQPIGSQQMDLPSADWFEAAFRTSATYLAHAKGVAPETSGAAA